MRNNDIIMKCCVCKRVKTEQGWQYQFIPFEQDRVISHGYCPVCYQKALSMIENEPVAEALEVAR